MPSHLILPAPHPLDSRRSGGGGGAPPPRNFQEHGKKLQRQLEAARPPRNLDAGVDPDFVFKIKAVSRPNDAAFEGRGLELLGETADYQYFILSTDGGTELESVLSSYIESGELQSFINSINDIEPYGRQDRAGSGINELGTSFGEQQIVDILIWPSSNSTEAARRSGIVQSVVSENAGRVLLKSTSPRRNYVRAAVTSAGLDALLNTSVIEQVRTPPVPFMDFRDWWSTDIGSLTRIDQPGEVVGVLDDAPESAHPLLNGLVLSAESLAPENYHWQLRGSHGTEVVGRVLFPKLHEELRDGRPITAVGAVRLVRILEPDANAPSGTTRFATYALPHNLVEQAIRHLHSTYKVRVFNLSIGYADPFDDMHLGPLTETIDELVRELKIIVVVPTGNAPSLISAITQSGHHLIDDKPEYFFAPEHRLSEPGPAALAITVGSVALSGAAAELANRVGWRAVSGENELSPFSRTGPGIGTNVERANKPDVTHYGGNWVVNDANILVANDPGASIISTSTRSSEGQIFATVNGTSFAAPAVARVAADALYAYPDASANLVRALIGLSAAPTAPAKSINEYFRRSRLYGLGMPNAERAILSDDQRVTMTYDGAIRVDTVQIHPIPIPYEFRSGSGRDRLIQIALAFDPPVRRQRREYLASTMKLDLYRDITMDELTELLVKQNSGDKKKPIQDRRKLHLEPGSNTFTNSTLQVRIWKARQAFEDDSETFLLAVTHKLQTWARNDPDYLDQTYAVAVALDDHEILTANLYQTLRRQLRVPTRIRIRS